MNARETIGKGYLSAALQYGCIELMPGHTLYSGNGIKQLGLKDADGKPFEAAADDYFFVTANTIHDCYGEENVMDYMDYTDGITERRRAGLFIMP